MIKRVIPLVALVLSGTAFAQIGIGTPKAADVAQLDIVATDRGILIPRIQLTALKDHAPIKGDMVESLLVYNTGSSTLEAGFYYWKSNAWTRLLSGDSVSDRKNNTFAIAGNPNKNGEESLVITDTENSKVYLAIADIANNKTFVDNLANNNEFISKVTNNSEFVTNIINTLNDKYGNVGYDAQQREFFYLDASGQKQNIVVEDLNTTNQTFALVNDELVVTDSDGNAVKLAVAEIANNETFVTNLAGNNTFVTKLGDNNEFISKVTNNSEFVTNIINTLNDKYGNVGYENGNFFYIDAAGKHEIAIEDLNTTNQTFALVNDELVVIDSDGNAVKVAVAEIANNETFVTNLAGNNTFVTKLGDNNEFISKVTNNEEFVTNIINTLNDKYGNVGYENGNFFYIDATGKHEIAIEDLNTTNQTFALVNDELVVTDSDGNAVKVAVAEIANNETFVTNLADNSTFVTKLGDNNEFISKVTNNSEFVTNIINTLNDKYGNVGYENGNFFYIDATGKHEIAIEDLNTTNQTFALVNDELVVTDSDGNAVKLAVAEIANNETFVTNLAGNNTFVTKLGDNNEFISKVTNNEEFVTNIINTLNDKYGNVGYENGNFFYIDAAGKHEIAIEDLNTTNQTFALVNDELVVTDSDGNAVKLAVAEIANNETFVTNLAGNNTFVTKLGDNNEFISKVTNNEEFVTNIINTLNDKYGNVGYENGNFFYIDATGKHEIAIEDLNTTNQTFALVNDELVVTDSDGNAVKVAVAEIANNETFVTNLADNSTFVTKLGDNNEFISKVTNNEEFVTNIINTLNDKYGNVGYENGNFFYIDATGKHEIAIEDLNTTNQTFALVNDELVVTDSDGNAVKVAVAEIANNETFVTNLAGNNTFVTKLGDNNEFISKVTNNEEFVTNIINTLNDKYGNVGYENGNFFYIDATGKHEIAIEDLNTTNQTFALVNDELVVTDSDGNAVK
ncbi:hypothetical protein, partial [Myroides sp. WP-1]|uniref:hypothetical protein n=1 Tax=Myroides sp. WP-1 TaxID=2759944 RepID=UPI0015FC744C